jgi:hypothetical protein
MSETWLTIGATNSAAKLVLKQASPRRGLGVSRLVYTFEITSRQQSIVGCQLWLGGNVDTLNLPAQTTLHLASFQPPTQPVVLPQLGSEATLQLSLEVTERQLQLIEEYRPGGVQFYIHLSGSAYKDGQQLAIPDAQLSQDIGHSDWLALLRQWGYRDRLLIELEPPDPATHPDFANAINHFLRAQQLYRAGEWRLAVESIRQCLAALVGKKPDDEEQEGEVVQAIKAERKDAMATKVGYDRRLELVRQAAKFMADLGAHPESAETCRDHAYAALAIAAGLLHAFTRSWNTAV